MDKNNIKNTEQRINQLRSYFESVLDGQKDEIRKVSKNYELRSIQPHIGQYYDCLSFKGKPFRIMIMGLEGLDEEDFSIERRTSQILVESSLQFSGKRSKYMKAVTLLLQTIIRDILGYDLIENEYFCNKALHNHIFNYFVLSNWHITGLFEKQENSKIGKPKRTSKMDKIAVENLLEQIKILEPTFIILLGIQIWLQDRTKSLSSRWIGIPPDKCKIQKENFNYTIFQPSESNPNRIPILRFCHPSDRGKNAHPWHSTDAHYFKYIIKPVLKEVISNYEEYAQPINLIK